MSYGVEQTTIAYLERRYAALEKDIDNALQHGLTDHPAVADLICRKLIVAEEIKHNCRLAELIRRTQTEQTGSFGFPYCYEHPHPSLVIERQ
jgi:hypothetical protein